MLHIQYVDDVLTLDRPSKQTYLQLYQYYYTLPLYSIQEVDNALTALANMPAAPAPAPVKEVVSIEKPVSIKYLSSIGYELSICFVPNSRKE